MEKAGACRACGFDVCLTVYVAGPGVSSTNQKTLWAFFRGRYECPEGGWFKTVAFLFQLYLAGYVNA